tara:strand:+ start:69 stop:578 length:510 start_codon:yes stop_codon:yes gene_type:complete
MTVLRVPIRVHACSAVIPICPRPQALDVVSEAGGAIISIYRVSADNRLLMDRGRSLDVWRRWLPLCWGRIPILEGKVPRADDASSWAAANVSGTDSFRITITPVSGSPPVDFRTEEMEMAILAVGTSAARLASQEAELPEHPLGVHPTRLVRHNNRFHQLAQEVDEIEL